MPLRGSLWSEALSLSLERMSFVPRPAGTATTGSGSAAQSRHMAPPTGQTASSRFTFQSKLGSLATAAKPQPQGLVGADWVGSAIKRTALPDALWAPLQEKVELHLGEFIREKCTTKQEAAMMAEIVGPATVQRHTDMQIEPMILEPVFMLPAVREALRSSVESDLQAFMRAVLSQPELRQTPQYKAFAMNTRKVFDSAVREQQTMVQEAQGEQALEPVAVTQADEVMGDALAQLLHGMPPLELTRRLQPLAGKRLPVSLRQFTWKRLLWDETRAASLAQQVLDQAAKHEVKDPAQSKVANLLQRMTQNVCARDSLQAYRHPETLTTLNIVLNHYYLVHEQYEARYAVLLLPILDVFPEATPSQLLDMLITFLSSCLPAQGDVRGHSAEVMRRLEGSHPALHAKLQTLMRTPPVRVVSYDHRSLGDRDAIIDSGSAERLLDVWFLHSVVGALDKEQCFHIWDQCFLQGWQELPKFCYLVVTALEEHIMKLLDAGELYDAFHTPRLLPWEVFLCR